MKSPYFMVLPFGIDAFSLIPALGAAGLSLKNWFELKQGAVLQPNKILNYGMWGIDTPASKNKMLIIPIILNNDGTKSGMLTNIRITFDGKDLEIRRKINLKLLSQQEIRNMAINEFRNKGIEELNPFYPIGVNSKDGASFLIECFDGNNIIPLDKSITCEIEIEYGANKSSSVMFPFYISENDFTKSLDQLKWLRNN